MFPQYHFFLSLPPINMLSDDTTTSSNTSSYTPDSDATNESLMEHLEDAALSKAKNVISEGSHLITTEALTKLHDLLDYLNESDEWKELVAQYRAMFPPKPEA